MGYHLGVDLGTTYTAAAVARAGQAEVVPLGDHSPQIASVVFLRDDGTLLVGEAALRRGAANPVRMAREFKRRLGDHTALMLGGTPMSPEALTARLLRSVVDTVVERQGERPERLVITRPANWGPFRQELLDKAVELADVGPADVITEPAAAAVHFASTERVEDGDTIAVYDLGGGTFDAAILRKTSGGFDLLGSPEGIEHLGGLEFDQAVLGHVLRNVGDAIADLDQDDPATIAGLARLRRECTDAKEALSTDSEAVVPVGLPGLQTTVRLTRAEFEEMVRPLIQETIACLRRAMASANVTDDDLRYVVLVGGSARVPLVAEMLGDSLGRPVAVSPQPKHSVALGAALWGAEPDLDEASRPGAPVDEIMAPSGDSGPARATERAPSPPVRVTAPSRASGTLTRRRLLGVAAGLVALMAVLAFVSPPLHDEATVAADDVSINGDGLTAGVRRLVSAGLTQPLDVVVSGSPDTASLSVTVLGTTVASADGDFTPDDSSVSTSSRTELDLGDREIWIAGPLRGELTIDEGRTSERSFSLVLDPTTTWWKTVPGWLVVGLALFALAYAESLVRPMIRRRRIRFADRVGMIAIGVLTGAAVIAASWSMGKNLMSPYEFAGVLLAGGALGACLTNLVETRHPAQSSSEIRKVS